MLQMMTGVGLGLCVWGWGWGGRLGGRDIAGMHFSRDFLIFS